MSYQQGNQQSGLSSEKLTQPVTVVTRDTKTVTIIPGQPGHETCNTQACLSKAGEKCSPSSTYQGSSMGSTFPSQQKTSSLMQGVGSTTSPSSGSMFGNRIVHMRRDATHVDTQALLASYKLAPGKKAVIVGVDFTDASRRAVEWAVRHFGQNIDSKLIFVHCYSAPRTLIPSLSTTPEQNTQFSDRMMTDFEAFMKRVMSNLQPLKPNATNAPGTSTTTPSSTMTSSMTSSQSQSEKSMEAEMILVEGRPYDELCALAEGVGCDALVVGYSNRTGLRSMMGSTSTSLVSSCHSSAVIVVK